MSALPQAPGALQRPWRLLCVCNEWPLPANSGGRIDVWRRLQWMHEAGLSLGLITWFDEPRHGPPTAQQRAQLLAVCDDVHLAPVRRNAGELLGRAWWLGRLPSHAASRWVTLDQARLLAWAQAFQPDALLLDGLYGAAAVRWLAQRLGVPWFYRSHNIEHAYMAQQRARAHSLVRRLGLLANCMGLRRLEEQVIAQADAVFDISQADADQWARRLGVQPLWLPTTVDAAFARAMAEAAAQPALWDLAYFGNLNTPNNVEAVRWLVQQVLPRLQAPALRVVVAGSAPSAEVKRLVASDPRVVLQADPPAIPAVAGRARVLVNPQQAGSGVNLKSVEMLFSEAALVSTPSGIQGLSPEAAACFALGESAAAFAQAVDAAHRAGGPGAAALAQRRLARQPFDPGAAAALMMARLSSSLRPTAGSQA